MLVDISIHAARGLPESKSYVQHVSPNQVMLENWSIKMKAENIYMQDFSY